VPRPWFYDHLACPDCGRDLDWRDDATLCTCGFTVKAATPYDLRSQRPQERVRHFSLGSTAAEELSRIPLDRPPLTYSGSPAIRDSRELFSAVEPWLREGVHFLDLGCGPRDQAIPAAHYGLNYVGVDFSSPDADLFADGHALPFRAATFDVVLAYAVLEHLYNPFLAVSEVARVLRPGGVFVGTVSQGEPFHDSYFHHTAFGVLTVFGAAELKVTRLWSSYDTLHGLSVMGRYPKAQRVLIEALYRIGQALPILAPRKFFRWTEREKQVDELHRAASICFVARRGG